MNNHKLLIEAKWIETEYRIPQKESGIVYDLVQNGRVIASFRDVWAFRNTPFGLPTTVGIVVVEKPKGFRYEKFVLRRRGRCSPGGPVSPVDEETHRFQFENSIQIAADEAKENYEKIENLKRLIEAYIPQEEQK